MIDNIFSEKPEPVEVLISIGSNMGHREKYIRDALNFLIADCIISDVKSSSVYETEPVGFLTQPWFLNIVVSGTTTLSPLELIKQCKVLENNLGRLNRDKWHEREIDIDIIFYGTETITEPEVTIPHPRMHERKFVLIPAAEIAGTVFHPLLGLSVSNLLSECKDNSAVKFYC